MGWGLLTGCPFGAEDWYCEREAGHSGDHFMHVVACTGETCGCYRSDEIRARRLAAETQEQD